MSRLQFSLNSLGATSRYEARLRRIAGDGYTPPAAPAVTPLATVLKGFTALALLAALAVSLAIWRIYDFPH